MAAPDVDFVLFDLGGVLVDPGGVQPMRELAGIDSDDELWTRWLTCRWVRLFESGLCGAEEFARGVVSDWRLDLEPDEFLAAFGGWPGGGYVGAVELVRAVRRTVQVGFLSNTNSFHWETHFVRSDIVEAFDDELRFLSFELGMVKPDRDIFEAVMQRVPAVRGRVLFLDDNVANVETAVDVGLRSARVRGVDEARVALRSAGVLTD